MKGTQGYTPIQEFEGDLADKVVLVRTDFNVPIGDDNQIDEFEAWRIETGMKTIQWLMDQGAKVIVISHIGRDPQQSLKPVAEYINTTLDASIGFIPEVTGQRVQKVIERMPKGGGMILENLRSDPREEKNDEAFAKELAGYAEIYVNDAFPASHREHASIVGIPKFLPAYVGIQCHEEIEHLQKALEPEHPLVVIIGGLKFKTKLKLLRIYKDIAETVIVGGALANTLYKEKGYEIGISVTDNEADVHDLVQSENVICPDYVVAEDTYEIYKIPVDRVTKQQKIVDLSFESMETLRPYFEGAKTIIWNGPLGYYEEGYDAGTLAVIEELEHVSAYKIVGGGDTVAVIRKFNREQVFDFVSTAGGAMLDFLVNKTLPGLEALKQK